MIFLILESTFMLNILKKNVKFDENIRLIATKGHLFNYIYKNKNIDFFLKEEKKDIISFFKEIDKPNNIIVIATDQDAAGELIAYEVSTFFKNAEILRFHKPIEELLLVKEKISGEFLFKYSTSKINILKAIRYLEEKVFSSFNEEKIKVLSVLNSKVTAKVPLKDK